MPIYIEKVHPFEAYKYDPKSLEIKKWINKHGGEIKFEIAVDRPRGTDPSTPHKFELVYQNADEGWPRSVSEGDYIISKAGKLYSMPASTFERVYVLQ